MEKTVAFVATLGDQLALGAFKMALEEEGFTITPVCSEEELRKTLPSTDFVVIYGSGEEFLKPIEMFLGMIPPIVYIYTVSAPRTRVVTKAFRAPREGLLWEVVGFIKNSLI